MAGLECDTCGGVAKGVASSSLGAVSYAYCQRCLTEGAEPLQMWHATLDCIGGPENIRRDLIEYACSWRDGRYIRWLEIVACYTPTDLHGA